MENVVFGETGAVNPNRQYPCLVQPERGALATVRRAVQLEFSISWAVRLWFQTMLAPVCELLLPATNSPGSGVPATVIGWDFGMKNLNTTMFRVTIIMHAT